MKFIINVLLVIGSMGCFKAASTAYDVNEFGRTLLRMFFGLLGCYILTFRKAR